MAVYALSFTTYTYGRLLCHNRLNNCVGV
jgi:hypothetical protein